MARKIQMQARSSADGLIYQWLASAADWVGSGYAAGGFPGSPLDISIATTGKAALPAPPDPTVTYVGAVAGRVGVPNTTLSAGSYNYSHPIEILCGVGRTLDEIIVELANWYGTSETPTGGTLFANAQLEYPNGVYSRIKFGGSNLGSVASGGTLISDSSPLSVPVPHGALATLHVRVENAVAVPWSNTLYGDVASGDALMSSASDLTGTHITDTLGGSMFPLAIRGVTSLPTYAFVGDSIGASANDNAVDATRHRGFLARAVASLGRAYVNMCIPGDTAAGFVANSAKRRAVVARCNPSFVICEYSTNDLNPGILNHSAATVEADLNSVRALLSAFPVYQTTCLPVTASGDGWTSSTQTPWAAEARRVSLNGRIRSGALTAAGFLETTTAFETALDSGIIRSPGKTADGLHPSTPAHMTIAAALAPLLP